MKREDARSDGWAGVVGFAWGEGTETEGRTPNRPKTYGTVTASSNKEREWE